MIKLILNSFPIYNLTIYEDDHNKSYINLIWRKKKYLWFPVSYREKIRVGRSEINFFFEYFFHGFGGFLLGDLQ